MLKRLLIITCFTTLIFTQIKAQNTLPNFSIEKNSSNQTVISWKNPFSTSLVQLTVKSSTDSTRNFRTIYSSPKPSETQGSYTDKSNRRYYYQIAYMLQDGSFYTTSVKNFTSGFETTELLSKISSYDSLIVAFEDRKDTISKHAFLLLRDSTLNNTTDSLILVQKNIIRYSIQHTTNNRENNIPTSDYLYVSASGNPVIRLPENDYFKYSIKIYTRDGKRLLYKTDNFNSKEVILNLSSFIYPGYYPYELFYENKIREKSNIEIK